MRAAMLAIAAVLVIAGLSGCLARFDGEGGPENRAPRAVLTADKQSSWSGESIEFDARQSTDRDGEIERWQFDFGDGTREDVTRKEDARLTHTFVRGGQYTVTVTVFDSGDAQGGALTDTASVSVSVNEEIPVAQAVLYASPPGSDNESPTAKYNQSFEVRENADRIEVHLDVQNAFALGSSELTFRLLDPNGQRLDEKSVTVNEEEDQSVELNGPARTTGTYAVEVEAQSGGAGIEGEIRVY